MQVIDNLALGFSVAITPTSLLYCFGGAVLGTLIGVLPGIGPVATIALLLPVSFTLSPPDAIIMLAAIYYGAQYGGSTTAILVNMPGESSSVVTAIDGYKLARQGRAGPALGMAAIASFAAGCFATVVIAFGAPLLGEVALEFRSEDYFSLMVFGLVGAVVLAQGSILRAAPMVILGLLFGLIGEDATTGLPRFTFGIPELSDGISFVALTIGLFGITEVIRSLEGKEPRTTFTTTIRNVLPSAADFRHCGGAIARGTLVGSVLGLLPGGGALLAAYSAYALEKQVADTPETFGEGDMRGVAAPEAANNAAAQTSFIPLLTLGIPANPVMALMIGALMIKGITPGPQIITERPELFWGLVASMWIGNLMLIVLNLPLVGIWVRLVNVDYKYIALTILLFCAIGAYSVTLSTVEIYSVAFFAALGYVLHKLKCEPAPLVLGFILGPLLEEHLRRSLLISEGNPMILLTRPISLSFLVASVALLLIIVFPTIRKQRELAMQE
jgi:putative tricarboxylic transport membrane protein